MMCWNEDPKERPSFGDMVKLLDNRMGAIAGYLDMGYNPFLFSHYDSLASPEYSTIDELPLTVASAASSSADSPAMARKTKHQINPGTKGHITDNNEANFVVDSGHYY